MESVDLAWRLGFEQGLQQAQLDQAQQQAMQADAMAQAQAAGQQPGQPGSPETEIPEGSEEIAQPENPQGDELDQHIEKLETMISKSEIGSGDVTDLKKTLGDIRSMYINLNLIKSMESVKGARMAKSAPMAPLKLTSKIQANMAPPQQKALSLQEQIVTDIFKKWNDDSSKATNDISSILNLENVAKKV